MGLPPPPGMGLPPPPGMGLPPPPGMGLPPPPGMGLPPPPGMQAPGQDIYPASDNPYMSEEDKQKMELEGNEDFMKLVKLYKIVKVPLANIKQKMKAEGNFEPKLIDLFADEKDIQATKDYN